VTKWADQLALFNKAVEKHGHIDHVFANAGIAAGDEYLTDTFDDAGNLAEPRHPMLAVNLWGATNTVKLGLHYLKKNPKGGSIEITSSAAGLQTFSLTDYNISKFGVMALMRSLHVVLPKAAPDSGIRVNALAPSWTLSKIVPERTLQGLGNRVQPARKVGEATVHCMVDSSRSGHCIFVQDSRFWEVDEPVQAAISKILPEPAPMAEELTDGILKDLTSRPDGQAK